MISHKIGGFGVTLQMGFFPQSPPMFSYWGRWKGIEGWIGNGCGGEKLQPDGDIFCGLRCLPTNSMRARRGLASTSLCEMCSNQEETLLHILRDCPKWRFGFCLFPPLSLLSFMVNKMSGWMLIYAKGILSQQMG